MAPVQLLRHGIEFSGFPERKWLHLGGIFGTKFTDTEDAEQRRYLRYQPPLSLATCHCRRSNSC